eukprot:UN17540
MVFLTKEEKRKSVKEKSDRNSLLNDLIKLENEVKSEAKTIRESDAYKLNNEKSAHLQDLVKLAADLEEEKEKILGGGEDVHQEPIILNNNEKIKNDVPLSQKKLLKDNYR